MKCPKCGKPLPDDSEFCQYCGERIETVISISGTPTQNMEKKCPKCGMPLPEDSDFCQYCGEKITPPTVAINQAKVVSAPNQSAHESSEPIFNMLANNMIDNIVANRRMTKKHTSDSDYGLVPEKPVFTFMVDGAQSYLSGLVTEDNEELTWQRKGSMTAKGISGPVDIYISHKANGEQYKTLYVSIYAETNAQAIPKGFLRKGTTPNELLTQSKSKEESKTAKREIRKPLRILLVILPILGILLLGGLNIAQFMIHRDDQKRLLAAEQSNKKLTEQLAEQEANNSSYNAKIEELNDAIESKDATISEKNQKIQAQDKTISSQEKKISSLETKADYYTAISSALRSGNIGYAASNFNCSQSIILVKKGETKKITLTANWSNGGTVSLSYSSYAANVDFDQDSWTYSTKLSIEGLSPGVEVVTFSNDVDTKKFKIIIIVE